eukprot:scaffold67230_cov61-Phaeocystis_antarctica.AAC.5
MRGAVQPAVAPRLLGLDQPRLEAGQDRAQGCGPRDGVECARAAGSVRGLAVATAVRGAGRDVRGHPRGTPGGRHHRQRKPPSRAGPRSGHDGAL